MTTIFNNWNKLKRHNIGARVLQIMVTRLFGGKFVRRTTRYHQMSAIWLFMMEVHQWPKGAPDRASNVERISMPFQSYVFECAHHRSKMLIISNKDISEPLWVWNAKNTAQWTMYIYLFLCNMSAMLLSALKQIAACGQIGLYHKATGFILCCRAP